MPRTSGTAGQSTVRLLDSLLLLWTVFWVVVGVWTGITLWQFSELGDTVSSTGEAVTSTGEALEGLGAVPVIGEGPGELGTEITAAGADVVARGQEAQSQLRQLAVLLGLAIALMPTSMLAAVYWTFRRAWLRGLLVARVGDPAAGTSPAESRPPQG